MYKVCCLGACDLGGGMPWHRDMVDLGWPAPGGGIRGVEVVEIAKAENRSSLHRLLRVRWEPDEVSAERSAATGVDRRGRRGRIFKAHS